MRRSDARLLLLVFSFLAFAGGTHLLIQNFYASALSLPEESLLASTPPPSPGDPENPITLEIPKIELEAPIVPVGLTKGGAMAAPEGPVNTGWFTGGVKPGEIGSAVIAGHRGFRTGPAVFDYLYKVEPGDEIFVTTKDGQRLTFVVKEKQIYGAMDKVPAVWDRKDGRYLNLITCSGKWNRLTKTSDDRLVVFTELKM